MLQIIMDFERESKSRVLEDDKTVSMSRPKRRHGIRQIHTIIII